MAPAPHSTIDQASAIDLVIDGLLATGRMLVGQTARSLAQLDANVTLPQFRTLVVLAAGPQRIIDIAGELGVQSSTVTRICDRLVRKGLVSRQERSEDRRATWVVLTTAGRDLVAEIMRGRRDELAALVDAIPISDPEALASVLNALVVIAGELPEAQWRQRWASSLSAG